MSYVDFKDLIVRQGIRPERPEDEEAPQMTDILWRLAERCWTEIPASRPKAHGVCDAISHEWRGMSVGSTKVPVNRSKRCTSPAPDSTTINVNSQCMAGVCSNAVGGVQDVEKKVRRLHRTCLLISTDYTIILDQGLVHDRVATEKSHLRDAAQPTRDQVLVHDRAVDELDPPPETYKAAQSVLNPGDSNDSLRHTLLPTPIDPARKQSVSLPLSLENHGPSDVVSSNSSNPEHSQTLHAQVGVHRSLHTIDPSPRSSGVQSRPIPNVIIFGESGVGKSSIINMLDGDEQAVVSNKATGVTFSTASYKKTILGAPFRIFDTVGLNEGSSGTVKPADAVERLYRLISHLGDGVNLLVYVMRSRIRQNSELNYRLFFELFCNKKVPIVILITGLETMDNMDEWWLQNEHSFDKYQMVFNDHACITSTKGRCQGGRFCYQDEYDQSKQKVERLISKACQEPWMIEPKAWFLGIVDKVIGLFESRPEARRKQLIRALRKCGGMSNSEARTEAKRIEGQMIADEAKMNDSNRFPVS